MHGPATGLQRRTGP